VMNVEASVLVSVPVYAHEGSGHINKYSKFVSESIDIIS